MQEPLRSPQPQFVPTCLYKVATATADALGIIAEIEQVIVDCTCMCSRCGNSFPGLTFAVQTSTDLERSINQQQRPGEPDDSRPPELVHRQSTQLY